MQPVEASRSAATLSIPLPEGRGPVLFGEAKPSLEKRGEGDPDEGRHRTDGASRARSVKSTAAQPTRYTSIVMAPGRGAREATKMLSRSHA